MGLRNGAEALQASGVRSIWMRHDLANFKQRLKALEAKVANDGIVLTEAQVQALEKKKLDDEAWGEIETAHPGYTKQRGPLLWSTGTTRNTAYCVIEGGVLLLRPLVYFYSGVDTP